MSVEDVQPQLRPNVLKARKTRAASRADLAVSNLAPRGGNPLTAALSALDGGAWVSPSRDRQVFAENLDGAGLAVTAAFGAQAHLCRDEAGSEPDEVDLNDDVDGWKADGGRIDSRASIQSRYGGGY